MESDKPFFIGITGGSASGKTMFLKKLMQKLNEDDVCLISQDTYYRPREEQPKDEKGIHNFDTPNSIDYISFARDVEKLKAGEIVRRPEYTYNNPSITPKTLVFNPRKVIIVEGIFVFYFPELSNQLDLKLFIDAHEHIKFKRRIMRDKVERGYELDDVLYRYEYHVAPTFEKYIKPFMYEADLVIPNNNHMNKALEVIVSFINQKIKMMKA